MYQALYRKWRPRIFDDVVGQEPITTTLKAQVKAKRPPRLSVYRNQERERPPVPKYWPRR
ncbi:MAG: hypothetical protein ACLRVT_03115 [Oscillospiraceae bacterium]